MTPFKLNHLLSQLFITASCVSMLGVPHAQALDLGKALEAVSYTHLDVYKRQALRKTCKIE